jgi:hypothetical protein
MPTISQLPSVAQVTPADEVPVSQDGATHSVSIGTLLASMQPAVISESGTLLGRTSIGAGGPEPVSVGTGLLLNAGTLAASGTDHAGYPRQTVLIPGDQVVLSSADTPMLLQLSLLRGLFSAGANISIDTTGTISATVSDNSGQSNAYRIASLTPVTTLSTNDMVAVSQSGTDHAISYANFIDGLTIDLAQPAVPATDTDSLWVAQGSSTMLRQTFAAVWAWLATKLPSYKLQVVEITQDTSLDGILHNGRVLICSQPITLSPAPLNMGNGFFCDVINLSGGNVILGAGITTSTGSSLLPTGQATALRGVSYSGGNIVFAALPGGGSAPPVAPGQVIGLTASNPTTSSLALSWAPPSSGGTISSYTVQYRITGTSTWSTFSSGLPTTNASVTGLAAGTAYDFQVFALNGGGAGLPSSMAHASTTPIAGTVISVTWNMVPSGSYTHNNGSIGVNAHINPGTAPVQFGFSTSATAPPTTWTVATLVNTDLWGAYVSTPAAAGTWYVWAEGTDSSGQTVDPVAFTVT